MSLPPYVYANGEVHGAEPERDPWADPARTPSPGAASSPRRGRGTSVLTLRARRRRTDPDWASRSKESQRLLLEIDRKEARGQ